MHPPEPFRASGHPGPGTDLPKQIGLILSTDGGATWTALSLAGESDVHALAVTGDEVIGFDGRLRSTGDGRAWATIPSGPHPYALAVSAEGRPYWPPPRTTSGARTTLVDLVAAGCRSGPADHRVRRAEL